MVYLIGTGPGDEELLTLKAIKTLKKCTAVLYDRLGASNVLNYLKEDCLTFYCGKEPGAHYKTQEDINKKIIQLHNEGHIVGRIKGGDPFVFGRGGEEIQTLLDNNIYDFEVIPGITSSISVLNYAGIPITHRGIARDFHIVTGMTKEGTLIDFENLAKDKGTLVFMMGLSSLDIIVSNLIKYGMNKNTKVAVIMKGTTSKQKKAIGTLENIKDKVKRLNLKSPCIIVIGEVVKFNNDFNWYEKKPLFGKNICITRAKGAGENLKNNLRDLGAEVTEVNSIKIKNTSESLQNYNLEEYNFIIFTSVNGVNIFFDYIIKNNIDIRNIKAKFCAIGSATKKALLKRAIVPYIVSDEFTGEAFLKKLKENIKKNDKVLLPVSKKAKKTIEEGLKEAKINVSRVNIYDTVCGSVLDKKVIENVDYIFYTSPSTVKNMIKIFGLDNISKIKAVAIGPVTEKELTKNNIHSIVCKKHSENGFIEEAANIIK